MINRLIAAETMREGVPILHTDAAFDALARHTPLKVFAGQP